jgi:hypothetical protein
MQEKIARGTAVLNNQLEGSRLRKRPDLHMRRGTTASWKRSIGTRLAVEEDGSFNPQHTGKHSIKQVEGGSYLYFRLGLG